MSRAVDKALEVVSGDRQADYGHPRVGHARTAELWSAFMGVQFTPEQVCILNALQKFSRLRHSPDHEDSLVDWIGWAINYEMCRPDPEPEPEQEPKAKPSICERTLAAGEKQDLNLLHPYGYGCKDCDTVR